MFQEMLIQSVPNFSEGRDLKKLEFSHPLTGEPMVLESKLEVCI